MTDYSEMDYSSAGLYAFSQNLLKIRSLKILLSSLGLIPSQGTIPPPPQKILLSKLH